MSSPSAWPNLREYNPAVVSHHQHPRQLPCKPQGSLVSSFTGKLIILKCCWAQDTQKTGKRALFATEYHHISLHSPACNSTCAAGSPMSSTTAARGLFSRNDHLQRLGAALKLHRQQRGRQRGRHSGSRRGVTRIQWGRRTYTPQYARDKAQNTSPMIYVRFHPGACCTVRARCNPVRARCNPAQAGPALGEARLCT